MRTIVKGAATCVAVVLFPVTHGFALLHDLGARYWFRRRFAKCGSDFRFSPLTSSFHYGKIEIGDRVYIGSGANLSGKVTIGDDVMFAQNVHVTDGYHRFDVVGKTIHASGPGEKVRVHVEADAWVGAGSTLMKGVRIGEGAVVGAKSLVLKDVPPYSVVVGSPARVVSKRFTDEELREHLRIIGRDDEAIEAMVARRAAGIPPSAGPQVAD